MPCLRKHPQFYYCLQDKEENARRLVLKPFVGNCNRANSRYSHCLCIQNSSMKSNRSCRIYHFNRLTRNHIPWLRQTHTKFSIYPVQDREVKNHTLFSVITPYRSYEGAPSPPGQQYTNEISTHHNPTVTFTKHTVHLFFLHPIIDRYFATTVYSGIT